MLTEHDVRSLRASQVPLVRFGEAVLLLAIVVLLVAGVHNLRLAAILAAEERTSLWEILRSGFDVGQHYPGKLLFTLERVSAGFILLLAAGLLAVILQIAASVRRRNKRILQFIEAHSLKGTGAP